MDLSSRKSNRKRDGMHMIYKRKMILSLVLLMSYGCQAADDSKKMEFYTKNCKNELTHVQALVKIANYSERFKNPPYSVEEFGIFMNRMVRVWHKFNKRSINNYSS